MNGLWLEDQQLRLRSDLTPPVPPAGEALVRVLTAGICNTDLELLRGYYPYTGVPGHEFVGYVEAGPPELLHQRVVGEINAACGTCEFCRQGVRTHCSQRTVLGIVQRQGAFAEYLCLPVENLWRVPEALPTAWATFTEPVAAALEIQQQVAIAPETRVLVVGDGKLGQLVAQTLALTGCDLLVVGRHPHKLQNLAARGIRTGEVTAIAPRSYEVAVECTGNAEGFAIAQQALRPRGTLVLKSTYAGKLSLDMSAIVVDELTLVGSRCGPFEPALALLSQGAIAVDSLIEAEYPLVEGLSAFGHAQRRGSQKILINVSSEPV